MDIQLIDTGFFHADGGAMFGAIPKTAWSRRYPSDEQNGCILAMRTLLVRDGNGKIVLVDNGAGNKHLKQLSYYNFFDLVDLKEELQRRGVACEEVTDIILTHLHFDHCGYTTQKKSNRTESLSLKWPFRMPPTGLAAHNGRISFIRMRSKPTPISSRICKPPTTAASSASSKATRIFAPVSTYGCSTDIHRDKSHLTSRHLSAHTSSQAMSSRWRQVFHLSGSPHTTLVPSYPTTRKCECWKRRP